MAVMDADNFDRDAWRTKVQDYIDTGDRGEEPCFVGRADLFDKVRSMVRSARRGARDSRTIIVNGAPGAGKTAFVREVHKRWRDAAVVVELEPGDMNPVKLFRKVSGILDVRVSERKDRARTSDVGASAGFAKARMSETITTVSPGDLERLRESDGVPWELLQERFGKHLNKDRPLILLCDEAQNLTPSDARATFLGSLHHGDHDNRTPIPLVPVFAGLADTRTRLRDCGLTRPTEDNVIPLSGLSREESQEYALRVLEHLGAVATQGELVRWRDWFVDNCDCWPQHLRSQMTAVAKAMRRTDSRTLRQLDGAWIARTASERRNGQYGDRLEAVGPNYPQALVAELAETADRNGGARREQLIEVADAYAVRTGKSFTGEGVVADAIHAGVLQHIKPGHIYGCPIPSLRKWLTGREHVVPPPPV